MEESESTEIDSKTEISTSNSFDPPSKPPTSNNKSKNRTSLRTSIFLSLVFLLLGYLAGNYFPINKNNNVESNSVNLSTQSDETKEEFVPVCDRPGGAQQFNLEVMLNDTINKEITVKTSFGTGQSYKRTYCDNIKVIDGNTGEAVSIDSVKSGSIINTRSNNYKILEIEVVDF